MTLHRRTRSARGSGADLRAEIIAATRGLMSETGSSDAVTIRAVARAVGVTAPSIYRHFADKDVLIDAVCAEALAELEAAIVAATSNSDFPVERLRLAALAYCRFAREHPEHYRITMMTLGTGPSDLDMILTNGAFRHLQQIIADCLETGWFGDVDVLPMSLRAWASVHGIAALQISKPYLFQNEPDAIVEHTVRAMIVGEALITRTDGSPPRVLTIWARGGEPGI
jgi:AcrR family transcriptional regulator